MEDLEIQSLGVYFTETGPIITVALTEFITITDRFPKFKVRKNPNIANSLWNPLGWEAHWEDGETTIMLAISSWGSKD